MIVVEMRARRKRIVVAEVNIREVYTLTHAARFLRFHVDRSKMTFDDCEVKSRRFLEENRLAPLPNDPIGCVEGCTILSFVSIHSFTSKNEQSGLILG